MTTGARLSPQQRRLVSLQADGPVHVAACAVTIHGPLDAAVLRAALTEAVRRHEILRTCFHTPPGTTFPVQVVDPGLAAAWSEDAGGESDVQAFAGASFDLERGPVVRARLTRGAGGDHRLFLAMPALCADDRALRLLVRELAAIYAPASPEPPGAARRRAPAADVSLQYADVAEWMNGILEAEDGAAEAAFWTARRAHAGLAATLPFERDARAFHTGAVAPTPGTVALTLGVERAARLHAVAGDAGVPAVLLACWHILLARLSGQDDVAVTVAFDGRNYEGLDRVVGLFERALPVALTVDGREPFEALVARARGALDDAGARQEYFEWGTDAPSMLPFAFDYTERADGRIAAGAVAFDAIDTSVSVDRAALRLSVIAAGTELSARLIHDAGRYAGADVATLAGQLLTLIDGATAAPATPVRDLDLLDEAERTRLVIDFNATSRPAPVGTPPAPVGCFHRRFEAQVGLTPDAVAVVSGDAQLSYRALNARANGLARHLRGLGVGVEVRVGVYLDRSVELLIALLGVLKAGGAYVPLDPAWPEARLEHVMRDAGMPLVLTRRDLPVTLPDDGPRRLDVDTIVGSAPPENRAEPFEERPGFAGALRAPGGLGGPAARPPMSVNPPALEASLAYVIYTSGSTGTPKGVRIEHRALANYLAWAVDAYHAHEGRGAPVHSSLAFDATITGLFVPLLAGRAVHLLSDRDEVEALAGALRGDADWTLVKLTPAHLELLRDLLPPHEVAGKTRAFVIGGEALLEKHLAFWRDLAPGTRLVNEYGPTETVVGCCVYDAAAAPPARGPVPIGAPIANVRLYVVDHALRPVARGIAGELLIGGAGVGRDYLGQGGLTAEKFVPDPFASEPGARLYRSGDLARHRLGAATGLEFLGRVDHQVKLRGFRVELGEIEAVLSTHPAVKAQVVVLHDGGAGPQLVAYVQATGGSPDLREDLRGFLAERLPDYMVPSAFMVVEAFALTPNGKIDRRALPAPEVSGGAPYLAPRTPTEALLADLWARLLGVERVGVHDHFFRLGGHSLLAARLCAGVLELFDVELPLRAVFDSPTPAGLAATVDAIVAGAGDTRPAISPVPRDHPERSRPSFAQQRLWFLDRLQGPSATYNIPGAVRLRGALDLAAVERAFTTIVSRHEALRTRFVERDGQPRVVIDDDAACPLRRIPLDHLTGEALDAEVARVAGEEMAAPFDLARDRLLRVTVVRRAPDDHVLLVTVHHIVADGWSIGVLIREFSALYASALTSGGAAPPDRRAALPPLAVQYADFACWQRLTLGDDVLRAQLDDWRRRLHGAPPLLELPTDRPRPAVASHRGASVPFALNAAATARLSALGRETGTTLFMVLAAGYALLLGRYSGQDDVVVGTVAADRGRAEIEPLIGFFVNTLCLRMDLAGDPTVAALLARVRRTCVEAFANQDAPFELVVDALAPPRQLSHAPIFQAMFQLQNAPPAPLDLPGLSLSMVEHESVVAKWDLLLALEEKDGALDGVVEFSTDLFDRATIERMVGHYGRLLQAMAEAPHRGIERLEMLAPAEQAALVEAMATSTPAPVGDGVDAVPVGTMHGVFEERVAATPDRIALAFDGHALTYREVERRANRLARHLRALGVGADALVAVCRPRAAETITALLAVQKAGGAYLPLDPAWPRERLDFMLRDSGARVLITEERLLAGLPAGGIRTVCLDRDAAIIAAHPATRPLAPVSVDNLAYVIYTSGSTGRPKGVAVTHRGIRPLAANQRAMFGARADSRVYQFSSLSFDASVLDMVMAFTAGATLDLGGSRELLPGPALAAHLAEARVTHMFMTPSSLPSFPDPAALPLETLIIGGEACTADALRPWKRGRRVFNIYGPTETTVFVTTCECPAADVAPPIGAPMPGTRVYLVDRRLRLVPSGFAGELLAGGVQLSRGYLNRPGLTAERFVPDPFGTEPGARVYRTGDLVRHARGADAVLEFVGRIDDQVKVHGFRIELGEIEQTLRGHPDVADAVVVPAGPDGLVAFVTPATRPDPIHERASDADLRAWLRRSLPDHMVPARMVTVDALPQTATGKIDRRALTAMAPETGSAPFTPPTTQAELLLAGIWADVLGAERVGRDDDFFALGGHSLLAMRVISRIRDVFGVEVPLRRLFEASGLRALAEGVASAERDTRTVPPIRPGLRDDPLPQSFAQQRLWFLDRLEDLEGAYHIATAARLRGDLDIAALGRALDGIVARHEALRTSLVSEAGLPVQVIRDDVRCPLELVRLEHLAAADAEREVTRLIAEVRRRPFDLARDPLVRVTLLRLEETTHVLAVVMHHVVADGWSMGIFGRELAASYEAHVRGIALELPTPAVQYADFACWQRHVLSGPALEARVAFWRRYLDGAPPVLELPGDRPRAAARSARGGVHAFPLDAALSRRIKALGTASGTTLFMTLLAGWVTLLARASGQDDLVVGSPVAGRDRSEIEPLIGFFVNMLPLRADLSGSPTVSEILARVRRSCLDAFAHQDLPFEKLVEELRPDRDLSHTPIFQAVFMLQNVPVWTLAMPGLTVSGMDLEATEAKYDLSLGIVEADDGTLAGEIEYSADLFDATTIERLAARFRLVLEGMTADPGRRAADITLVLPEEEPLLTAWNETATIPSPRGSTYEPPRGSTYEPPRGSIHAAFEARVAAAPHAVAVIDGDHCVTAADLNRRANRVAHRLRRLGVGPEVAVGVCAVRSIDMLVALLGVLKAGGAYVPLDPAYPRERLAYMAHHARLSLVLAQSRVRDVLPDDVDLVLLDEPAAFAGEPERNPRRSGTSDLAYVLYTSGSTGVPKGVAGRHASTLNRIAWMQDAFPFEAGEVCAQKTSLNFVDSVWEIWAPLLHGVPLVVLPDASVEDPRALVAALSKHRVSRLVLVPSLLRVILDEVGELGARLPSLRSCVSSGEALPADLAQRFSEALPHTVLLNLYGSTEVAGDATCEHVVAPGARVPIGRPIAHLQAHVVESGGARVAPGLRGELYVGGIGLARGYHRMPALTAERFVPDPFGGEPGTRLFRTGDLARHLADGRLEYLGRADHQVKIRGFRVEPAEIEMALRRHGAVAQALVTARPERRSGEITLVAYVVPREGDTLDVATLRQWARAQLPGYMVPAAFVALPALPLTPNGKVDRKALPPPDLDGATEDTTAPRTTTEALLAAIWADVLGRPRIGVHASFFDLGGHSLLATRVIARVHERLGVDLPVRALFEHPTIAGLAERLGATPGHARGDAVIERLPREARSSFPLSFGQERVWFLERFEAGTSAFHIPIVWKLTGAFDRAAFKTALETVVRRHESLRTVFPDPGADGTPWQVVLAEPPSVLSVVDLRGRHDADGRRGRPEAEARPYIDEAVLAPFDLATGPLLRVVLVEMDERVRYLVVNVHHIVADGWSMSIFVRELADAYVASTRHERRLASPLPFQYADFAAWQRRRLGDAAMATQLAYWTRQLAGDPEPLDFPTDHPRPPVLTFHGDRCALTLPASLAAALTALARQHDSTLFMTLLAAFDLLLARHAHQTDILVGTPVAGRHHVGLESQIGMFLNNLVLRTDVSGDPTFTELIARVREVCLAAYDNQDVPLEKLIEALRPRRDLSRNALYQVLFNMLNMPPVRAELPGVVAEEVPSPEIGAKYDFTLYVAPDAGGLSLGLNYNAVLFSPERMITLLAQYAHLLAQIVADPGRPLSAYDLVDERSVSRLPDPTAPLDRTWNGAVHELFHRHAVRAPDRPAVIATRATWTYAELAERVDRLAATLIAAGVRPGDVVAIFGARAAPLVQAIVGTLRAGAAFLMLDPAYPPDRIARYLELAQPRGFIELEDAGDVAPALRSVIEALPLRAKLRLSADGTIDAPAPGPVEWPVVGPDDAAVIAFTSGSTGIPKGVVGRHGPLTHFYPWMAERFGLDDGDRYSLLSGLAHDPLQRDVFTPLCLGAAVAIPDPADIDPNRLAPWMRRARVTVTLVTPAMADILTQVGAPITLDGVRRIFLVGDRLTGRLVAGLRRLAPRATIINMYGSTETQRSVSYHVVGASAGDTDEPGSVLPLGRGMKDAQILVLTPSMRLAGVGERGDIYMRGPHLARGYLGDEAQTRRVFLTNPFTGDPLDRIYRTGDLGWYMPDGEVAFFERADLQVKIRGFRVELTEIEAVLGRHPLVREAVVVARGDGRGDRQLVAYVRHAADAPGGRADAPELRAELSRHVSEAVPGYMVPAAIVLVDAIPLTPNNKVDRAALAARPLDGGAFARGVSTHAEPATVLESEVVALWEDLLDRRPVGVDDNFFELGGHSLLAVRVVARVRERFGTELPLQALFEAPTARGVAARIEAAGARPAPVTIVAAPRDGALPLSFSQQRLWVLDRLEGVGAAYNIPAAVRLEGALDVGALGRALDEIVHRHEALRTSFTASDDGEPVQVIHEGLTCPLSIVSLPPDDAADAGRRHATEEAERPFDLESAPLVRATLLRLGEASHVLLVTMHHIVSDGWSIGVLVREFMALYEAFAAGQPSPLPPLPIQYADYAVHQRTVLGACRSIPEGRHGFAGVPRASGGLGGPRLGPPCWLEGDGFRRGIEYWREQCAGAPALLDLPLDRPRPPVQSYRGGAVTFRVDATLTARLDALGLGAGATLFMTLFAGFSALLARLSGQDDFLVGVPVANRTAREVEPLIGFFVNTLALRADAGGDPTVRELLARVRRTCVEGFAHQDVPFERLVEALRPERSLSHAPVFQVMLVLHNTPSFDVTVPGLTLSVVERETTTTKFDLTLSIAESVEGLDGRLEYNADVFERATIERHARYLRRVLEAMVDDPERRLSALPLVDETEAHFLLTDPHRRRAPSAPRGRVADASGASGARRARPTRVTEHVAAWAARAGDRIAVAYGDDVLTYGALSARANRFAHALRHAGVGPDVRVGLCVDRSLDLVIGVLAILNAGGAYVPLDPSYPAERLAFMRADAGISVVVTQTRFAPALAASGLTVVCLDGIDLHGGPEMAPKPPTLVAPRRSRGAPRNAPTGSPPAADSPDDSAYVIYTSGSTGQPKGVAVSHRTLTRSNDARFAGYGDAPAAFLLLSSVAFDSSVVGLFWTLAGGGTLCIPSGDDVHSARALTAIIERRRVSHVLALPSLYGAILDDAEARELASLASVIVAGEACPEELIALHRARLPGTALFNEYGPTEATVWSAVYDCRAHRPGTRVAIGVPIAGSRSYVLDRRGRLAPLGVTGELYVGGATLARGYVDRPGATAERFLPDPYGVAPGARMYRTGDVARYRLDDGHATLEFLGRADDQVKIRGFRVEPGEIERVLARHDAVREAVIVARADASGALRLTAYVRASDDAPSAGELRAFLAATLPDYMIPSTFVVLDVFPLTPNGKVDRRALPAPEAVSAHEPPATPTEVALAALWAELLGLPRAGALDHFFEAGGHSLLATRLLSRIRKAFGIELALVDLFRAPVLRSLAEHIDNRAWSGDGDPGNDHEEIVL